MKELELFANKVYYFFFAFDRKVHFYINKINPFLFLLKIDFLKKRLNRKWNIEDPLEYFNEMQTSINKSVGTYISLLYVSIIVIITLATLLNFMKIVGIFSFNYSGVFFIFLGFVVWTINYYLYFKNNKFINYFSGFEDYSKNEKQNLYNQVLSFLLLLLILFGLSLYF